MTRQMMLVLFTLLSASPLVSMASPQIVTTIKPVGLIAKDIAGDFANVDVLLPDNASPHDYALKPSDLKKLRDADRVIWIGPELELFLSDLLEQAPNAVQLTAYEGMPLRQYDGDEQDNHRHDHSHNGVDGHLWLGPEQAKVIAQAVFNNLKELDPEHSSKYAANLETFLASVDSTAATIKSELEAHSGKGYFLFHDGYGYFEQFFEFTPAGYITIDPERKPGAKTLVTIRNAIREGKVSCVFSEPQFNPSMVETLVKGTNTHIELLDPMAKTLELSMNGYADFLKQLGDSYLSCFNQS